jgi:hypothetical protein
VEDLRAGAGLVVADRVGRHGVSNLRDQWKAIQAADAGVVAATTSQNCRHRGSRSEIMAKVRARDNETPEESDEIRFIVMRARRADGEGQVGAGGSSRDTVWRAPSQERMRI